MTGPASAQLVVEASGIAADYSGLMALNDVDLQVRVAQLTAIIGPNGAGKSTLLKLLTGMKKPLRGTLRVCGMDIQTARRANTVAYVPQETDIDWDFPISVRDVVLTGRYGRSRQSGGWCAWLPPRFIGALHHEKARAAMAAVQVDDLANRSIGALSGGQKKRVFIARSIAQEADLMLLDEPLAGVDRRSERIIIDYLKAFVRSGRSVLMVTHDLPTVRDCADWVVLVNRGIAGVGNPEEMLAAEALEKGYHRVERGGGR